MFKVNFKGGSISTGALSNLLCVLEEAQVDVLHLGQRQNLYFDVAETLKGKTDALMDDKSFDFEIDKNEFPNIISSYVGEDVFTSHPWVSEGMYQDVLESFMYRPRLKINIVDPTQGLVPLFTGNINIVCSTKSVNFWFVYVKHVSLDGMQLYPQMIYTTEIGAFCEQLEMELLTNKEDDLKQIAERINKSNTYISTEVTEELVLDRIRFPHYEGMVSYENKNWLGIYRRNNNFSKEFLAAILDLCAETKIAEIHITPWQTLAIKGVAEVHRILWEKLLGKYGVNIRHSALELNWQLPDLDPEAQELKMFLVRQFDEHDIRTYGLSFSVKSKSMEIATSVIIEKRSGEDRYNILFAEDFNPTKQKHVIYAEEVDRNELVFVLERLCRKYYEQLNSEQQKSVVVNKDNNAKSISKIVMQCKHCFTIYDPEFGDEVNSIKPGVLFTALNDNYCCSVCDAPKSDFQKVDLSLVV